MRFFWLICISFASLGASLRSAPPEDVPVAVEITDEQRRLLTQLDAADFKVRERAERTLYDLGFAAIPLLESAALNGDTGAIPPALRVLERMLIEACPDLADEAERALERLAFAERPETMSRAREVLAGNYHLRQRRAVAAIRELKGRVEFERLDGSQGGNVMWLWGGDPRAKIPGQPFSRIHVLLVRDWIGGEEGLWHLKRLEDVWSGRLWGTDILSVRGNGVPMESVQALAARVPNLRVQTRGASLGIKGSTIEECRIGQVLQGGPADKAGLQNGDVVEQLNDIPISTFGDLVGNLLDFAPEDRVVLKIRRGDQELDVPVVLGNWRDLNVNQGMQRPTPLLPRLKER